MNTDNLFDTDFSAWLEQAQSAADEHEQTLTKIDQIKSARNVIADVLYAELIPMSPGVKKSALLIKLNDLDLAAKAAIQIIDPRITF